MKLSQISTKDAITQQVIARMILYSTALKFAEFYAMVGNAEYARKSASATGGQFRQIDANYPANAVSPDFANPALKILGDNVQVDQAHERRGFDLGSVRATELLNFAGNLGRQFQYYFFNGDTENNAEQFNGLKLLCPDSQKITASANGLSVDTGNSDTAKNRQQKFLEALDQLIEAVDGGAQALFMDGKTLSRLSSIAREYITIQTDQFGVPQKFYNGIPVEVSGYDRFGNRIIAHDESVGNASTCTSVYAVRFGEKSDLSIATNKGLEVNDLGLVGNFYTHRAEFDATIVLLNNKAVARLEGIIIS